MKHWILGTILTLSAVILIGCGKNTTAIQIKGSDTMVNLGGAWAEAFMNASPDAKVAVTGGGSGTGIAALINRTCDLAQSSRTIKDEEREQVEKGGQTLHEIPVALDALTVVVHPSNPISELTISQISEIFTRQITNWSQLGGPDMDILVLSRERNSGTHVFFLEEVVRQGNSEGTEEYAAKTLMLPSSQAIANEIETNAGAIGYFGLGYLNREVHQPISVAKTAAGPFVAPTMESASSGAYPIARPLFFYITDAKLERVQALVNFVLSPTGQEIVKSEGFAPLQ